MVGRETSALACTAITGTLLVKKRESESADGDLDQAEDGDDNDTDQDDCPGEHVLLQCHRLQLH